MADFDGQHEDEEVQFFVRQHPVVMRKELIALLVIILIFCTPFGFFPLNPLTWYSAGFGLLLGIAVFMYGYIGWYYSMLIVTDMRVVQISQSGLFNRRLIEVGLDKIQNVNFTISGMQETILHFGRITIQTFAGDLVIDKVGHPQQVHEKITRQIKKKSPTPMKEQLDV